MLQSPDSLPNFGKDPSSDLLEPVSINDQQDFDPNKNNEPWFEKAYPFKAIEFGQLILPENVLKAKLVSLNNYGSQVPNNLMKHNRHHMSDTTMTGTYCLFTVEENDYLTLYKIKSYLTSPLSSMISNFKMAKKTSLLLEHPVE